VTKPNVKNPFDLACCLAVAAVLGLFASSCASARAGQPVCRIHSRQAVVHHAPLQARFATYATPYFYEVAPELQGEAHDEYQFRRSPQYQELLELRGYARAVERFTGVAATASEEAEATEAAPAQPQKSAPAPATAAAEKSAVDPNGFEARYPTLAANCMKCHTGDEPKGGVWIDGSDPFEPEDLARFAAAVVNGRMPKNHEQLEAQLEYELLVELFTEHAD
jgi:hypothetical protein